MEEILTVRGLTKTFRLSRKQQRLQHTQRRVITAVNNLSFSAYKGEIFGLLGPNGAGKTTTLRMLATLISPDSGDASVDGFSIISQPEEVRSRIGFLTGELKLENFFTPNYLFNFFSELYGVEEAVRAQRKAALFSRFGIDRFAEVKLGNLSSGMKQKVSLAVSVVNDPDFIIFDEPTNGLDVLTAKTVTDWLTELKGQGKTVILSTHIFSLVEKICDRVGVIIDGKLAAIGTVDEVSGGRSMEDAFFDIYAARGTGDFI